MKAPALSVVLGSAAALLAAVNLYQFGENRRLAERVSELEDAAQTTSAARTPRLSAVAKPTEDPTAVGGAVAASDDPPDDPPATADGGAGNRAKLAAVADEFAKSAAENPAIQKQMLAQFEAQLGGALDRLIEHLELEGEELAQFKRILGDHWRVQSQAPMRLMSAMGDEDKIAAVKDDLRENRAEMEARMREFLNDDGDFDYFLSYQKQLPDRMEVNVYRDALESQGVALSNDQVEQLVSTMAEERAASGLGDVNDPTNWDMDEFSEETVTTVIGQMSDFHSRVQLRAGTFLDQAQLGAVIEAQQHVRQQQELGMKFGLQMMEAMRPAQ